MEKRKLIWYKDWRLIVGVSLIIGNIVLGFYSKVLFITNLYRPFYLITGLSLYAISWLMLFLGAFLIGWETIRLIRQRINHHVRKTVKNTYDYTKQIPRKSMNYTKNLGKRFSEKNKNKPKELEKND